MASIAHSSAASSTPVPVAGVLLGLLSIAMGAFIGGIGLGWIPCDPESLRAPRWVVGVCGAVFAAGGVGVFANALGRDRAVAPAVGAIVLVGLAVVCHWIAFADGERRFTATTFVSGLEMERRAVDEQTGRTAFAVAAVSLDVLLVMVAGRAWRARRRPAGE